MSARRDEDDRYVLGHVCCLKSRTASFEGGDHVGGTGHSNTARKAHAWSSRSLVTAHRRPVQQAGVLYVSCCRRVLYSVLRRKGCLALLVALSPPAARPSSTASMLEPIAPPGTSDLLFFSPSDREEETRLSAVMGVVSTTPLS